jgi:hypothetical protein
MYKTLLFLYAKICVGKSSIESIDNIPKEPYFSILLITVGVALTRFFLTSRHPSNKKPMHLSSFEDEKTISPRLYFFSCILMSARIFFKKSGEMFLNKNV